MREKNNLSRRQDTAVERYWRLLIVTVDRLDKLGDEIAWNNRLCVWKTGRGGGGEGEGERGEKRERRERERKLVV